MTDLCCSVCWAMKSLTQVAGTIICKNCLAKAVKKYQNNDDNLPKNVEAVVAKEDDIYT